MHCLCTPVTGEICCSNACSARPSAASGPACWQPCGNLACQFSGSIFQWNHILQGTCCSMPPWGRLPLSCFSQAKISSLIWAASGRWRPLAGRPAQFLCPGTKQNSPGHEYQGSSVLSSARNRTPRNYEADGVRATPQAEADLVLCRCNGRRDQSGHFFTASGFGNFHDPSSISSRGEYMRTA